MTGFSEFNQPKIRVGVLGATGAVGQRFVQMLQGHPWFELSVLCASQRNVGKRYADACNWLLRGDMPPHLRDCILQGDGAGHRLPARVQRLAERAGAQGRGGVGRGRLHRMQQCQRLPR